MKPAQPVQGLIDGLSCLQSVLSSNKPSGSREVGRRCDLNRTRANRLLGTWRYLGVLQQTEDLKYAPGPALHVLAGMGIQASGLLQAALPIAESWWQKGYSVSLGVRWQDKISFLLQAPADTPFLEGIGRQYTTSALCSSAGLAMLSAASASDLKKWDCAKEWEDIGDDSTFKDVIKNIQANNYATRLYPHQIRSIGVRLNKEGQAALAISKKRMSEKKIPEIVKQLHQSADDITKRLQAHHAPLEVANIPA